MADDEARQRQILPLLTADQTDQLASLAANDGAEQGLFLGDLDFSCEVEDSSPTSWPSSAQSHGGGGGITRRSPAILIAPVRHFQSSSSSSSDNAGQRANSKRQKLERRGHTKSRRGCFNCKRRRIKCQETRPACGHCVKNSLSCEYPAAPLVTHQPQHQLPVFSLQDMRFFQHFLQTCYPTQPLGNESIWTHEVPCLAQEHEYLMHAILGLSACELMAQDPSLVTFAMAHRLKSIKAIQKALNKVSQANTFEEGNALVATCFALTFQSVCLNDGMVEYMTFCRGILIVAYQMYFKGCRLIFHNLVGEEKLAGLQPALEKVPPIRVELTDAAVVSLKALDSLLVTQVQKEYHEFLVTMAEALYTDSYNAYKILCEHYGWWMQLPHEQFQQVVDPGDPVMLLLGAHWIALKQIMAPITAVEREGLPDRSKDEGEKLGMIRWLKYLNRSVLDLGGTPVLNEDMVSDSTGSGKFALGRSSWEEYLAWPLWVEAQLDDDLGYFGRRD